MSSVALWLAQGLGIGRIPLAPGTFGSLAGIGLTALLLLAGHPGWYVAGVLAGVAVSVWACGEAEQVLQQKDPGSVVLDEIVAVPLCYAGWLIWQTTQQGGWLRPGEILRGGGLLVTFAILATFRFFDVLKPWPVRQSQALPAGWGITTDDLLAAVYVNLVLAPVWWLAGTRN